MTDQAMTSEMAALKIQLSEEINKQRELQKQYEIKQRDLEAKKQEFLKQQSQRDMINDELNNKRQEVQVLDKKIETKNEELTKMKEKETIEAGAKVNEDVRVLEEQIRRFEAQIQMSRDTAEKKQLELQKQIDDRDASIESLFKQIKEKDELTGHLKKQISSQMTTNANHDQDKDDLEQIKTISSEYVQSLDVKISSKLMKGKDQDKQKMGKQVEDLNAQLQKLTGQNKEYLEQINKQNQRIEDLINEAKKIAQTPAASSKADNTAPSQQDFDNQLQEALKKQQTQLEEQEKLTMKKMQDELTSLSNQIAEKDEEMLKQETGMLRLTEEIEGLKAKLEEYEASGDSQAQKINEMQLEIQELTDQYEQNKRDLYEQLDQKDQSLSETYVQLQEAQKQISTQQQSVDEAEHAIREYRAKMRKMDEDVQQYEDRYNQNEEETAQVKQDMQQILGYKNDLELLIEEQSQNISVTSKRVQAMEETLRFKDDENDKKDGIIRRMTESNAETKKKLMQAEVKIRQLTQATIKDLKLKIKGKQDEINVLKEMVKSSSQSLKAKDIDINRLTKRNTRLEKLVDINKNLDIGTRGSRANLDQDIIQERDEQFEDTGRDYGIPNMSGFQGLDTQVNQELIMQQNLNKNSMQRSNQKRNNPGGFTNKLQQREWEEAMELDRILEEERRQQSLQVFANQAENNYDKYMHNLDGVNNKNKSRGMAGVFGMGDTGGNGVGPDLGGRNSYFPEIQ